MNRYELLYYWRLTANQFFLATSPLRPTTSNFIFQLNTCDYSPCVISSLIRGWVCRLQLLLVLASAVTLRSESRGTHDHILLSQIRDSPNMEGQVPLENHVIRFFLDFRHFIFKLQSCRCAELLKHYAMNMYEGVDV
jgi:hypothetical protein